MSVIVVVGGQFGSEGKGKVIVAKARQLEKLGSTPWFVRCGGPNSGHTVEIDGKEHALRQLPSGAGFGKSMLFMGAGCVINPARLIEEVEATGIDHRRLVIDPRCVIIDDADIAAEKEMLIGSVGSTASGTGAAMVRRMMRTPSVVLAAHCELLTKRYKVEPVAPYLHQYHDHDGHIIVEGTQGFGLSLLHGPYYPFCTSRDTTAAQYVMECGLSPMMVDEIIMCLRTFPIRVGGNSGPLYHECTWDDVQKISGAPHPMPELTSVTKRPRRVGHFDMDIAEAAVMYNRPTSLAVLGADRIDYASTGARQLHQLTARAYAFLYNLQEQLSVPIKYIGTGPAELDIITTECVMPMSMLF